MLAGIDLGVSLSREDWAIASSSIGARVHRSLERITLPAEHVISMLRDANASRGGGHELTPYRAPERRMDLRITHGKYEGLLVGVRPLVVELPGVPDGLYE